MNNIDILEELKNKQYTNKDILGNLVLSEEEYTAISTLIAENKELKEINFRMAYNTIKNEESKLDNYIEKSKVEEIIKELQNDTCKIINRTYIPTISSKLFNDNREKYEPMLEARNILINALNKLQSLLGKE